MCEYAFNKFDWNYDLEIYVDKINDLFYITSSQFFDFTATSFVKKMKCTWIIIFGQPINNYIGTWFEQCIFSLKLQS